MNTTHDRPTNVLERPRRLEVLADRHEVPVPRQARPPLLRTEPDTTAVPLGWGSVAERRLMRQVLVFFAFLGLYAAGFVVLGTLL
jgi:hypothetical protein